VRHLNELKATGLDELVEEVEPVVKELHYALVKLEDANLADNQPEGAHKWAKYMRDTVIPAMDDVREVADRLEKIVADDLWPLPKYSEMLFIK
jgi:glutamine synthetase